MARSKPVSDPCGSGGDANRWLQKIGGIVSGLLFTMKIPTTTCGPFQSDY
jgi:hypothetical protein